MKAAKLLVTVTSAGLSTRKPRSRAMPRMAVTAAAGCLISMANSRASSALSMSRSTVWTVFSATAFCNAAKRATMSPFVAKRAACCRLSLYPAAT